MKKKPALFFTTIVLAVLTITLSACGFHPLYGENKYTAIGAEDQLSKVAIDIIPDREGVLLRNELIDRLHRNGSPEKSAYTLSISNLEENLIDLDITKASDTTRGQLIIKTTMILNDRHSGKNLLRRTLQSTASYNLLDSEFSTRVSEQNTRENVIKDLARQIELQLALYFKRN